MYRLHTFSSLFDLPNIFLKFLFSFVCKVGTYNMGCENKINFLATDLNWQLAQLFFGFNFRTTFCLEWRL